MKLLAALLLAGATFAVEAQQLARPYRIAYLTGSSQPARTAFLSAFRTGMQELGYREGQNMVLEARYADGNFERLPELAQELIRQKPDVLFVSTTPAGIAAKKATSSIPIVFVAVADPVGAGLVPNLSRPGGNITGITNIVAELTGKRLELLKEIVPAANRVAILVNPDDPNTPFQMRNAEEAAKRLRVQLQPIVTVRGAADLEGAFETAIRGGAGAALRMVDPTLTMLRHQTAAIAIRHRLPVAYPFLEDVEVGGLVSYGTSLPQQYQQAASLVHKILRGARPADLPVEQPTKFEFAVNTKTARAIGVTVPRAILLRADKVIE